MGLRTVFLSWVLFDTVGTYGDFVLVDTIERRGVSWVEYCIEKMC